jgi:hypothetical protein
MTDEIGSVRFLILQLHKIADELERMWIDRETFRETLLKAGFTPEQIQRISDDAQADPERQKQSRQAYAQMRASLEEAGKFAAIDVLARSPPPPDKAS